MPPKAPRKRKATSGFNFTKRTPPKLQRCVAPGNRRPAMEKLNWKSSHGPSTTNVGVNVPNSVRLEIPRERLELPKAKAMPTGEARVRNWAALLPDLPKAYLEGIGSQEPRPEALEPLAEHNVSDTCTCQKIPKVVTCVFMCGKYTYSGLYL